MQAQFPKEVIHTMVPPQGNFPGNPHFPLLIYKNVFQKSDAPKDIQSLLKLNQWGNSWIDGIYPFHHHHAHTHEVLVMIAGTCEVQFGGDQGIVFTVQQGDVAIIPAGVSHKSLHETEDFQCIGAYPSDIAVDMHYGKPEEYALAIDAIKQVGLPAKDPVFGKDGLLFEYWKPMYD